MVYNHAMKIMLHICCGPCAVYPVEVLRGEGAEVTGFFFNHNIHPYQEYRKRLEAAEAYCARAGLELVLRDEYRLEEFLAAVSARPEERCRYCYASRLERTAREAADLGCDAFSTTLLYSRYQRHEVIREEGERAGNRHGVRFLYRDFRPGWRQGIDESRRMGLYRQQYCGCIYSEKDRYAPRQPEGAADHP
jgi:predicted adenine nucleotide alpha hydrolase (AANH) superfamily ATPase